MLLYIGAILLGLITGFWLKKTSKYLIDKRLVESDNYTNTNTNKNAETLLWITINALCWFCIIFTGGLNINTIEFIFMFSACTVLSVVDIKIKKIPNELLLFILITGIVFIFIKGNYKILGFNLIGCLLGLGMFLIPSLMGKGAGLGDVKFAAVVGFCLGIYDFLVAIIIMSLLLVVYFLYIKLAGKGNIKTKVALGPFMAFGYISVLFLNVINSSFFGLGALLSKVIK